MTFSCKIQHVYRDVQIFVKHAKAQHSVLSVKVASLQLLMEHAYLVYPPVENVLALPKVSA